MTSIEIRQLSVAVGRKMILESVDLDVAPGEWLGVIGPNGAGKTTLLSAIIGLIASTGSVRLDGTDVVSMSSVERARRVALVPQRPLIPPGMRVIDYVLLGRTPHMGLFRNESKADLDAIGEVLERLELGSMAGRKLGSLSGGELQRVVLARALAQAAPILLLDEPSASLDVGHAQAVMSLVDDMRRDCNLTVVSAIHDLTLAGQFCDRLVMVSGGRVVSEGTARTVLTETSIRAHYGATVRVIEAEDGAVVVIPIRDHHSRLEDAR